MSRIGIIPVAIPAGVTVEVKDGAVVVKGKLGELSYTPHAGITAEVKDGHVVVTRKDDSFKNFHGLARTLISNMITGVVSGYTKSLEIEGVGFKAAVQGQKVILTLGFANPKEYSVPAGASVAVDATGLKLTVTGTSKELVGRVAADIRAYYPAEPYKGKGIKYAGEKIRRKEGKTVA